MDAPISRKQFFGLKLWFLCSSVDIAYILIDLNKKKYILFIQTNKNCLLEIGASNLEGPLLKFQYSKKIYIKRIQLDPTYQQDAYLQHFWLKT